MNWLLFILGDLCLTASVAMLIVGMNDSKLTELRDFFWAPILPGILLIVLSFFKRKPPAA